MDGEGALYALKFVNQDFDKIDFETKLDAKFDFVKVTETSNLNTIMEYGIDSLLRLISKTCKNQNERIQTNLVQ